MSARVHVDLSRLSRLLAQKAALAGTPVQDEALSEMMRFTRQIIKYTPPSVNKATAATLKANDPTFRNAGIKRIARQAIVADLNRAVTKVSVSEAKSPLLQRAIDTGRADILQQFLDRTGGAIGHTAIAGSEIAATHKRLRNSRGRVPKISGIVTLDKRAWQRHLKTLLDRVGYMKCGWSEGWQRLAAAKGWRALPQYITRHAGYAKTRGILIRRRHGIRFEMVNATRGIRVIQHAVTSALKLRERAIARNIKFLMRRKK